MNINRVSNVNFSRWINFPNVFWEQMNAASQSEDASLKKQAEQAYKDYNYTNTTFPSIHLIYNKKKGIVYDERRHVLNRNIDVKQFQYDEYPVLNILRTVAVEMKKVQDKMLNEKIKADEK